MPGGGILREIVTLFGFDVDKGSFDKAESSVEKLRRAASVVGQIFVTGVVARGIASMVEMASDAQQTTALMGDVFAASAGDVEEWSRRTAGSVGRSEFELQRFASSVGAMVAPLMGAGEEVAKLSQDMAQTAVDIAAVFNTSDEEALVALRSGLAGETEPLRRYGVVLTQAAQEEFARNKGITKNIKDMTEAEKVQLRYAFIMERTSLFTGRAAKEADEYAGAVKALRDRLKDLAVRIGQELLPGATRLALMARDGLNTFLEWAKGSRILETAIQVLGAAAAALALKMILPFAPVLLMWAGIAAAVAAVIVVVDDLKAYFKGEDSLTGLWSQFFEDIRKGIIEDPGVENSPLLKFLRDVLYLMDQIRDRPKELGQDLARWLGFGEGIVNVDDEMRARHLKFEKTGVWDDPYASAEVPGLGRPSRADPPSVNSTVNVTQTINAAPGQDAAAVGDAAAQRARDVLEQQNRKTLRALVPQPTGG